MANNYFQFSLGLCGLSDKEGKWLKKHVEKTKKALEDEGEYWSIDSEWCLDGTLALYAEESGNIEALADLVQEFIRKFRPDSSVVIEWAATCSAPRVGEFGGGAVAITAEEQYWIHPSTIATDWLKGKKKKIM